MRGNILLINPRINPASQNKIINQVITTTVPTSIGILAGYLESKGLGPTLLLDEQVEHLDDGAIRALVLSLAPPRVVGLTVLTISSRRAYDLARLVKEADPTALVVLGGIHATVAPEEALARPEVDAVARGEGELTLTELISLHAAGKDWRGIPGISVRSEKGPIHNPDRPLVMNLDEIPPFPYHLFERSLHLYNSFGGIFTSRGCPYNCFFCSSRSVSGKRYRYYSPERIVAEISLLAEKYGQKTIWLMDDNISAKNKQFMATLDAIMRAGLHKKVCFHGSLRGDNATPELLARAKEANFRMLSFGLETGSERLMKIIDKGETVQEVLDAIRMTDAAGIAAATTVIFGLPTETRQERWDAMRTVRGLPLSSVRFNTLTPYPGTPAFERLNKEGKVRILPDWANFAVQYMWEGDDIPYVPDGESRYTLMFDTMFANLSFYLSPSGIRRMIRSSYAGGNVVKLSSRWYLSFPTLWRLFRVFLYLTSRFSYVTLRMLGDSLSSRKA